MQLNLSKKNILIIEDYSVMRKSIISMLHTLGAETIHETINGTSAIAAMEKHSFDIVLCDYNLGEGRNGQQILDEAKHKKLLPINTLFIIVTAEQAASNFLNALENKPDEYLTKPFNPEQLQRRLEKCYTRKQFLSAIEIEVDKGNYTRAIHHCDALLNQNHKPLHTQLLKIRADLAIHVGDFKKAEQIYQQALEQREFPWAKMGSGVIAYLQSDYPLAIEIFQNLIEQHPMLMECYDWLVKSYEAIDKIAEAEQILTEATQISPYSFFRQKKLALLAERSGNLETAEKAYLAVTQLGKHSIHKSPSDFSGLAHILLKNNKTTKALKTLAEMQGQFSKNPEAELRSALLETEVYQKNEDDKRYQQAFKSVMMLYDEHQQPPPKDLQLEIAKLFYLNHKKETADDLVNTLIQNHIDDEPFINDIRNMYKSINQEGQPEELIQQIKQHIIDINNRGVNLYQQGKTKEAFSVFEQAIEKMPSNKTIVLNMTKITLHNLKASGTTKENLMMAHSYLKRAKAVGVAADKLGSLQLEFEKLTQKPLTKPATS